MAYTTESILTRALALRGGAADEGLLSPLCAAAAAELEARLRDDVSGADIEERFTTAAALLALSLGAELDAGDAASSIKAGNVSVTGRTPGGLRGAAAGLRREAETMMAAYIKDGGFAFKGVRG